MEVVLNTLLLAVVEAQGEDTMYYELAPSFLLEPFLNPLLDTFCDWPKLGSFFKLERIESFYLRNSLVLNDFPMSSL